MKGDSRNVPKTGHFSAPGVYAQFSNVILGFYVYNILLIVSTAKIASRECATCIVFLRDARA